ncbi:MAG: sensor histidine kinase [Myxococcales bacterium]
MNDAISTDRQKTLDELQQSTQKRLVFAFTVLQIIMVLGAWGRWTAALALLGFLPLSFLYNVPFVKWLRASWGVGAERAELWRLGGTLAMTLAMGHLCRWDLALWMYVVLYLVVGGMFGSVEARRRAVLFWLLFAPAAFALGAAPFALVVTAVASYGAFLLVQAMFAALAGMVDARELQRRELEAAHAELQRLHRTALNQEKLAGLGMLAAGIAHEINNPMSYVTSNVGSLLADLRAEPALSATVREYVDEVLPATLDGIRRVNSIVGDLRRFARGDGDHLVRYDLNDEIEAALRLTQGRLTSRCEVKLTLGELPEVLGRPRQIGQVLVNLIVNAAQAIEDTGTIEVTSAAGLGEVSFSVRDTGCGMDERTQQHLFEPFFTTKPLGEGTGLGLAVIHGIVTDHGGRIEVESAPGRGSRFTVTLPREPPDLGPRAQSGVFRIDALVQHGVGPRVC